MLAGSHLQPHTCPSAQGQTDGTFLCKTCAK